MYYGVRRGMVAYSGEGELGDAGQASTKVRGRKEEGFFIFDTKKRGYASFWEESGGINVQDEQTISRSRARPPPLSTTDPRTVLTATEAGNE